MHLPVEPGRLIGGRKIEDALYTVHKPKAGCSCAGRLGTVVAVWKTRKNGIFRDRIRTATEINTLIFYICDVK